MKLIALVTLLFLVSLQLDAQNNDSIHFETINNAKTWQLQFEDACTENWNDHWFLDGQRADIQNTHDGMVFSAGPVYGDNSCHAVLWTRASFEGDIKIEYSYTRTDTHKTCVNILYIQATGVSPYSKDIWEWKEERTIPYMSTYFTYMEALHISYAAFNLDNNTPHNDYIRARKYPDLIHLGEPSKLQPSYYKTELFKPGIPYKITAIKSNNTLYFHIEGDGKSKLYTWDLSGINPVSEGRIGLRHMYTRSARYKNFRIHTR